MKTKLLSLRLLAANTGPGIMLALLVGVLSPSAARAQLIPPSDPTQPTPLQQLNGDLSGDINSNGYNLTPPPTPQSATRPGNWAGGKRRNNSNAPGQALSDAEGFTPEEAQRYSRELKEQAQRAARLGGPPAVPEPLYNSKMQAILSSPYELSNSGDRGIPVITDARPLSTAPPPAEEYDAEQVVYQAPINSGAPQSPYDPTAPGAAPIAGSAGPPIPATAAAYMAGPQQPGTPPGKLEFNNPSMVIARVDQDVILLSDVLLVVNEELAKNASKIPPEQMAEVKRMFIEMAVRPIIEAKLVTTDLKGTVPEEGLKRVTEKLNAHWEKEEYRAQLRTAKVESRRELEAEYRRVGTTLERERKRWLETELAKQWMGQQIKFDEEVTHEQMLKRYHADVAKYEVTAGVRWEELKATYTPATRPEAWRKLAEAGNQILSGAPLADIAKRISAGTTAAEGGARDWTSKGSLAAQVVDDALFSLPVGQLSGILDDGQALYIVRVVERRDAGVVPFTEAQAAIKKEIQQERIKEQTEEYMKKLYAKARVWTIFDAEKTAQAQGPADRTARAGN